MAAPGPHTAFFYGTLMAPTVLYRVLYQDPQPIEAHKRRTTSVPALLTGYQRRKGGSVRGLLVSGLSDADLSHLDTFEGEQYERVVVRVEALKEGLGGQVEEGSGQEMVEAETYVWSAEEEGLRAEEWDFGEFQREKMSRWDGVGWEDSGFDDVERQIAEEQGRVDATGGRAPNGKIGRELGKRSE